MNCEDCRLTGMCDFHTPEGYEREFKEQTTWDTEQLQHDFDVLGFQAPFVVVRRKSDGAKGSLEFNHSPRIYYNFVLDA